MRLLLLLILPALLMGQVTVDETVVTTTVTETTAVNLTGLDGGLTAVVSISRDNLSAVTYTISNAAGDQLGSGVYDLVKMQLVSQSITAALGEISFSAAINGERVQWSMTAGGQTVAGELAKVTGTTPTPPPVTPPPPPPPTGEVPVGLFVSPTGSASGDGSISNPWDLKTALSGTVTILPGTTVWMRGGVYGGDQESFPHRASGTATSPIVFRSYPGEWARVQAWIHTYGSYTWFRDFEVFSAVTNRSYNDNAPNLSDGFDLYEGTGNKLINLVIRNRRNGIGDWVGSKNTEIYGNLIYYNGAVGPTRGHYHGVYAQNQGPSAKRIENNIFHDSYGYGIQLYGGGGAWVDNFIVKDNFFSNAGSMYSAFNKADNILIGGAQANPKTNILVEGNVTYHTPASNDGYSRIGLNWDNEGTPDPNHPNRDVRIIDNAFLGGENGVEVWWWDSVTFTGNTVYTDDATGVYIRISDAQRTGNLPGWQWDNNVYYAAKTDRITLNGSGKAYETWRAETGLDANSTHIAARPSGTWVTVVPNKYEAHRGTLSIANWDGLAVVPVNLSEVLAVGVNYEVLDSMNYFGTPVATGVYDGSDVLVPMNLTTVEAPVGKSAPAHTAPEFGVFVVKEAR